MAKEENKKKPKIIVILGPTASGKTGLGVKLAYEFEGEIVSADSRQVYRDMDIGTGKDLPDYTHKDKEVPYHLIDVASPLANFNLARYQKMATKAIKHILKEEKLPVIVGGTGLYIQAIVDNYKLSNFKSNREVRDKLEQLGAEKLFEMLRKENPEFAERINNSDKNNARRLSRYLELVKHGEQLIERRGDSLYDFIIFGTKISDEKMKENIIKRLNQRIDKEGMIEEVKNLRKSGISYDRLISFGLEYRYVSYFLKGEMTEDEMREKLATAIYRFAKRQKTWFKRFEKQGQKIHWITDYSEIKEKVQKFLKD